MPVPDIPTERHTLGSGFEGGKKRDHPILLAFNYEWT